MKRFEALLFCSAVMMLILGSTVVARADTKADMVAIMDKLGEKNPSNESLVDWDHLIVNTPQTKNMNFSQMYASMDETNKKAFRTSFLSSYADSFKKTSGGHKFSDAAKQKDAITITDKGDHPFLILRGRGDKSDLKIFFTRKGKALLFQGMETKG